MILGRAPTAGEMETILRVVENDPEIKDAKMTVACEEDWIGILTPSGYSAFYRIRIGETLVHLEYPDAGISIRCPLSKFGLAP